MDCQYKDFLIDVPDELVSRIPDYIKRRKVDFLEMCISFEENKIDKILEISHRCKGHGTAYGFEGISFLASEIERSVRNNEAVLLESCIDNFGQYMNYVCKELKL